MVNASIGRSRAIGTGVKTVNTNGLNKMPVSMSVPHRRCIQGWMRNTDILLSRGKKKFFSSTHNMYSFHSAKKLSIRHPDIRVKHGSI
jgi:hypothetical protein